MNIQLINPYNRNKIIATSSGLMEGNKNIFPYKNGAFRIVRYDNYTENFGYQWNKFSGTQVDTNSNTGISKTRFFAETSWDKISLAGKNILEVGSGAGRFSQVVLEHTEAELYSVDYSNAVEANYKNNGPNDRLHLYQASIYEMPFEPDQFDKVVCLGVLQHTPDVERSVKTLIDMVKPGGEVVVDFYPINGWWTVWNAKYIFRPLTKKMSHEKLYKVIDKNIDWLIKLYQFLYRIKLGFLTRFLPICDINETLPKNLSSEQLREWCVLDTFDMFSPEYDQPQKIKTVVEWFKKYGMKGVTGEYIIYENCKAAVVKGVRNDEL